MYQPLCSTLHYALSLCKHLARQSADHICSLHITKPPNPVKLAISIQQRNNAHPQKCSSELEQCDPEAVVKCAGVHAGHFPRSHKAHLTRSDRAHRTNTVHVELYAVCPTARPANYCPALWRPFVTIDKTAATTATTRPATFGRRFRRRQRTPRGSGHARVCTRCASIFVPWTTASGCNS